MSIQYKLGALAVSAMLMTGNAFAKTYGVWLKGANGAFVLNNVKCATGTVDSVSRAFNMTIAANCFSAGNPAAQTTISETGAVVKTAMIQSKDEQPVSSADGVEFPGASLTLAWASNTPAIGTRTFVYNDGTTQAAGTYHLFTQDPQDPVNQIPEPETLILALAGLAGLAWTRRKRR
jgi:hypothetical protein